MPRVDVKFDTYVLQGGLDLHTPQIELKQGVARAASNFECSINGGYTRIPGYERFDGHASPTAAVYTVLVASAVAGLSVGDAINGQTSGATATVAQIDGLNLVITQITGTFVAAENLRKVATVIGTITTVSPLISDKALLAAYQLSASNIYRNLISPVPGSGSVLGGFTFNNTIYAFRNNAGGTAAVLYASSGSGWAAVALPYELKFTAGGGTQPAEGSTITQGAVTAVVKRVVVKSGSFTGGNAVGTFILAAPSGGNFAAGALTAGCTATLSGVQTAVTLLPSGRFEISIGDAGNGQRVYGTDGVNRLFEFDGAVFVPIDTGLLPDAPLHCTVHKHHIFVSSQTTAQHAGVGTPYVWTVVFGAAAFAVNSNITAFLVLPGSTATAALAILSNDSISILYGTGVSDWILSELNLGIGCKPYAARTLTQSYIHDDLGLVSLQAVQAYGNFIGNTLTVNIRQFVQSRRTLITDSLINREKSQYRVFYSDGYALYATIVNGNYLGAMPIQFPNPVTCAWRSYSANGVEISFFGSTNGFVYQMETGTSFDGAAISASFDLSFAFQGNMRELKLYRKAAFEVQGTGYTQFLGGVTLAYGDQTLVTSAQAASVNPTYWDQFTWDNFVWDGRNITPSVLDVTGTAENVSIHVEQNSALWPTYTINSVALHYTPRRILRH